MLRSESLWVSRHLVFTRACMHVFAWTSYQPAACDPTLTAGSLSVELRAVFLTCEWETEGLLMIDSLRHRDMRRVCFLGTPQADSSFSRVGLADLPI